MWRNQVQYRHCRVLFTFILLHLLWQHVLALDFNDRRPCREGNSEIPRNCINSFHQVDTPGCGSRYFCSRQQGEKCNDSENKCMAGLTCNCGVCQNCGPRGCHLNLCSNEIFKRFGDRFPPWYRNRWPNWLKE